MSKTTEIRNLIDEAEAYVARTPNRKPADVLGRVLRHPDCALDWKTATVEDFAAEAVRLGWDFATLARMGI